jgi:hypothetical protein
MRSVTFELAHQPWATRMARVTRLTIPLTSERRGLESGKLILVELLRVGGDTR